MIQEETKPSTYFSPKVDRERAKELAQKRRAEQRSRKRSCSVCGVSEDDRTPFIPHPDGIGPICSNNPRCLPKRASRAVAAAGTDWKR